MNKSTLAVLMVFVALVVGTLFLMRPADTQNNEIKYQSSGFGIEFLIPDGYFIGNEVSLGGERVEHAIILAEDNPGNRALFSGTNSATDGPPTITISIYQNDLDNYTTKSFVEGTSFSNFKLSDGKTTEVMVGGEKALRYHATGLYENENIVIARPKYVYMFTVFYNSPTDKILSDFDTLISTIKFSDIKTPTSADNAPPGSIHNLPVPKAVSAVRAHIAKTLGINEGAVIVMTAYEKTWSNGCLDLAGADEMCTQALVDGYEVTAEAGGKKFTFHTNFDGTQLREKK